jgi:hypothetical protein
MNWLVLLASLAAVFALAGFAWLLGTGKPQRIANEEAAKRIARENHSGFLPVAAAVDATGTAAIAVDAAGHIVLMRCHGARIVARYLRDPGPVKHMGSTLQVDSGERLFGTIALELGPAEALAWHQRLRAEAIAP